MIAPGKHGEHLAELVRLRRQVAAVRALHYRRPFGRSSKGAPDFVAHGQTEFPDQCDHCQRCWPCDTIRALDAPPTTTDEEATNDGN